MYTHFGTKRDIENVMEQIGEQIGNFIQQVGRENPFTQRPQEPVPPQPEYSYTSTNWPQIDVEEDEEGVYMYAELPGMEKSDIHIVIDQNNVLKIRGEKKQVSRQGATRLASERSTGTFARSIALPDQIDPAAVQAEFTNGLLTITIGKKEHASGIRVEIR